MLALSSRQFDHPYVHIRRVKEFKFREILTHAGLRVDGCGSMRGSPDDADINSVDNLVTVSWVRPCDFYSLI